MDSGSLHLKKLKRKRYTDIPKKKTMLIRSYDSVGIPLRLFAGIRSLVHVMCFKRKHTVPRKHLSYAVSSVQRGISTTNLTLVYTCRLCEQPSNLSYFHAQSVLWVARSLETLASLVSGLHSRTALLFVPRHLCTEP
jgi:hypothetical protein